MAIVFCYFLTTPVGAGLAGYGANHHFFTKNLYKPV
jgi:hypothetical protein